MVRRLKTDEKALWNRVIATVQPSHAAKTKVEAKAAPKPVPKSAPVKKAAAKAVIAAKALPKPTLPPAHNLDGHWDRRINKGGIVPDVSVDLHDSNMSGAYARLDGALEQAIAQQMKVVLLVTGRARNHDRASGEGRGAIAAVVRDWLAASRHASHIAAVRAAHPRHGGAGALYIMLKR